MRIYARKILLEWPMFRLASSAEEINRKNLRLISQSVKEPVLSASESTGSSVTGVLPTPLGQFFQIHGNIFSLTHRVTAAKPLWCV